MLDTASHRQVSTLAVLAAAAVLSAHAARRRCAVLADRRDALQRRVWTLAARRRAPETPAGCPAINRDGLAAAIDRVRRRPVPSDSNEP